MDTALSSESGATLEVDRYIAVPAQALSYKIGQLKVAAIRSKAEKALGGKFDIRAFHDELLRDSALPLDLLEQKMDRWIALNSRGRRLSAASPLAKKTHTLLLKQTT
jgi:uncharacterized protein (DUF885 family)